MYVCMYVCMYVWKNEIHGGVCYVVALWRSFPVLLSSPTFLGSMSSRFVYILTYIHTCVFTEIHTYISYTYITMYLAHEHILHIHTYTYIDSYIHAYIHVLVCTWISILNLGQGGYTGTLERPEQNRFTGDCVYVCTRILLRFHSFLNTYSTYIHTYLKHAYIHLFLSRTSTTYDVWLEKAVETYSQ